MWAILELSLHEKMKLSIKYFFIKCAASCDLVIFTEEILNEKLHFLCRVWAPFTEKAKIDEQHKTQCKNTQNHKNRKKWKIIFFTC